MFHLIGKLCYFNRKFWIPIDVKHWLEKWKSYKRKSFKLPEEQILFLKNFCTTEGNFDTNTFCNLGTSPKLFLKKFKKHMHRIFFSEKKVVSIIVQQNVALIHK